MLVYEFHLFELRTEIMHCVIPISAHALHWVFNIKQLLDEVEHDIMNYQSRGLCYLPKPKAEADNTDTRV